MRMSSQNEKKIRSVNLQECEVKINQTERKEAKEFIHNDIRKRSFQVMMAEKKKSPHLISSCVVLSTSSFYS